jgi:hypothetical protein
MEELYIFVVAIIYISIYKEPQVEIYWNVDFNKGFLYSITSYISLYRFEQIKRYCYISCLENNERAGYHLLSNRV